MTIRDIRKLQWDGKNEFIKVAENLHVEVTKNKKVFKVLFKKQGKQIKGTLGDVNNITLTEAKQKVLTLRGKIQNKNFEEAREIIRSELAKRQSKKDKEARKQKELKENKYKMKTLLETYIKHLEETKADAKKISRTKNYILPLLKDYDVRTVTHTDIINSLFKKIQDVKLENATRSRNKKETARKLKYILNDFFKYCMLYHNIHNNPVILIDNRVFDDIYGEDKVEHIKAVTDINKLREIYHGLLNDTNARKCTIKLIQFIFLTALRFGSATKLKYEYVDDSEKVIRIPSKIMKARKDFVLPLTNTLLDIIEEMKKCNGGEGYIFACRDTGQPSSNTTINKLLKRLSDNQMTIHGTRSALETIMLEQGVNFLYVSSQLAHSLKRVTGIGEIETYNRSEFVEQRRELLKKWEKLLTGKTSENSTNLTKK